MNASIACKPAVTRGGELTHPLKDCPSLAEALRRAARHPAGTGLRAIDAHGEERRLSYRELAARASSIAHRWRNEGLSPGGHILLSLDDPLGFSVGLWACIVGGFVAIPLGVGQRWPSDEAALKQAVAGLAALDPIAIVCSRDFHPTLLDTQKRFALNGIRLYDIDAILDLEPVEPTDSAQHWSDRSPEQLAIIFPTSGSTGTPKPVTQTGAAILAMAAGSAQVNDFSAEDVFLNWMPMEHVGSTVFLSILPVCVAAEQIHIAHGLIRKDILRWLDYLHAYRASVGWVPNYVFNVAVKTLEKGEPRQWDLSRLRFLVNAGESITPLFAERFIELLGRHGMRRDAVRPAFGMSETCSGISWAESWRLARDRYAGLGKPIPGAEMRIVDRQLNVVEEGAVGRLHLRGPSVTRGYYKAGRDEKFLDGEWFDTGDSGFIQDGELYLTDRENDEIVIKGEAFHSYELEADIEKLAGVAAAHTAVCAVEFEGVVTVAVYYVAEADIEDWERLRAQVEQVAHARLGDIPCQLFELQTRELPKTSIGKIQRKVLRRRFQQLLQAAELV